MTPPLLSTGSKVALAASACVLSALATGYSSPICRDYYARLQELESERWLAQEHYSRLLLEESTLGSPHRVLGIADEQLGMEPPSIQRLRVVRP